MNTFYNDVRADIIFHLKRGAVVVSEDDLIMAFGRNWGFELTGAMKQDVEFSTVAKSRIRLSMDDYISD